jgi:hypothetical protein
MNAGSETRPVSHPTWSKGQQKNGTLNTRKQDIQTAEAFGASMSVWLSAHVKASTKDYPYLGTRHAVPGM